MEMNQKDLEKSKNAEEQTYVHANPSSFETDGERADGEIGNSDRQNLMVQIYP